MSIQLNSRLRVNLPFVDRAEDGTLTPIALTGAETLRIVKPDGTDVNAPTLELEDAAAGLAYWEAAEGDLDQTGLWRAQGYSDGYLSSEVSWRVRGNP